MTVLMIVVCLNHYQMKTRNWCKQVYSQITVYDDKYNNNKAKCFNARTCSYKILVCFVLNRVKPCIAKANPRYSPIEKAVNHFVYTKYLLVFIFLILQKVLADFHLHLWSFLSFFCLCYDVRWKSVCCYHVLDSESTAVTQEWLQVLMWRQPVWGTAASRPTTLSLCAALLCRLCI